MYMRDWIEKPDDFLRLSDKEILSNAGRISAKLAKEKADAEYDKFRERTANELTPAPVGRNSVSSIGQNQSLTSLLY